MVWKSFLLFMLCFFVSPLIFSCSSPSFVWVNPNVQRNLIQHQFQLDDAECKTIAYQKISYSEHILLAGGFFEGMSRGITDGIQLGIEAQKNQEQNIKIEVFRSAYFACMAERGWRLVQR